MVSPRAVKRALRTLATERRRADGRAPDDSTDVSDARSTISTASEALEDVESAAAFAAGGGFERVRDAIDALVRAEDTERRRVGEATLSTVETYRRAADATPASGRDDDADTDADAEAPRVGTHLGGDGQRADR